MARMLMVLAGLLGTILVADPVLAVPKEKSVTIDHAQVQGWNRFADGLMEAHRHIVSKGRFHTEERIGGYYRAPEFYREVSYYEAPGGRLVSRVRWERDRPSAMHAIELFFYDETGRLKRDYGAYYLPGARNAPVQTLINFHHYERDLHAFRQFDASGDRLYEDCKGTWFGDPVAISLDEPLVSTPATLTASEPYIACFGFLPATAGKHLDPAAAILGRKAAIDGQGDEEKEAQLRIAEYSLRLKLAPRRPENYVRRAKAYFRIFEFDKAIADLTRALDLDDGIDEAYFWRGMARGRGGQLAEGIADLTVFIARNPKSSLAYTKRGVRHIWKGNFASAETDLTRAIALDPRNAEAYDDLGVLYARREDYDAAIESFRTTIHLDPSYEKAHHNLALVLHLVGQNEEALMSVDMALRLGRRTRSSALLKAAILQALGRLDEAQALKAEAELLPGKNWSEKLAVQ